MTIVLLRYVCWYVITLGCGIRCLYIILCVCLVFKCIRYSGKFSCGANFADRRVAAKIKTSKISQLVYVYSEVDGAKLNFLLEGWEANSRSFAPAKISYYIV